MFNFRSFDLIHFLGVGKFSKNLESLLSVIYLEYYTMDLGHMQSLQHVGDLLTHVFSKQSFGGNYGRGGIFKIVTVNHSC